MYKNYLFDLYGTLADIHTDEQDAELWEHMAEYYKSRGADYSALELEKTYGECVAQEKTFVCENHPDFEYVDIKIEKVFLKLYKEKGVKADNALALDTAAEFRKKSREYIKLYDGIAQLLDDLKNAGKNVYLLTNAQRAFTWDELEILGIRDKFDGIVISSDEECCKPDSAFYKIILDRYNLDPKETIMSGNDPTADILGAQAVGLDTLYIHTNISPQIEKFPNSTYLIKDGNTAKMRDYLL